MRGTDDSGGAISVAQLQVAEGATRANELVRWQCDEARVAASFAGHGQGESARCDATKASSRTPCFARARTMTH